MADSLRMFLRKRLAAHFVPPFVRRSEMRRLREMDFRNFQSLVDVNVAWQNEATRILGLTIATDNGQKFPTRAEFAQCLRFLARLSGAEEWRWLLASDPTLRSDWPEQRVWMP